MSASLPRASLGLGLRPPHYRVVCEQHPAVDYFEIISDNFITDAAPPHRQLAAIREHYPIVLHGVGLNLLGAAPLDEAYIDAIARLADAVDAPFVSDHLCWTGAHGVTHHDLLPTPYVNDIVDFAASRAAHVQARIGRPFGLENLSTYVEFSASSMPEHAFYTRVVRDAGCHSMLDINNLFVSSHNHGFDPLEYLEGIDYERVLQVHLAGHTRVSEDTIVDTHDSPVCDQVWALYAHAWRIGGPFPTLIEWDTNIPPMPTLLAELERAREVRA